MISTVLVTSSPGVDSWNHFLCSSIRSNSHPLICYHRIVAVRAPFLTLVFWLFTTSVVISFSEMLNDSESSMRVGICLFQTPLGVDIWPLPMNHECSQWHLGLWLPAGGLQLTLPRFTRSVTVCGSCGLRKCASSLRRLESQRAEEWVLC